MTFARVNTLGWALFEELTSAQMNALDIDHSNAVDGLNGGAYGLLSALSFTGAPVSIVSPFQAPGAGLFNIRNYGADLTGVADSTTAIQDAIAAAFAAGGGDVIVPPGIYKRSIITLRSGVNLRGYGNASILRFTGGGATNGLVFIDNLQGPACEVSDIQFDADAANTGTSVVNNSGRRIIFRNCTWNEASANLQGKLAVVNAAGSELIFEDCKLNVAGTLFGLHASAGTMRVVRGILSMPVTYSGPLAYSDGTGGITLDGTRVNVDGHLSGASFVLYADNTVTLSAMRNCDVEGAGSGNVTAFGWLVDAYVVMTGNRISLGVAPFQNAFAPNARSLVELSPYAQQDWGTNPSIDLRTSYGYRTHLVANSGPVSIILPAGVVDGQELCFIYFNSGVSSVAPVFATTPVTGTTVPTIGVGNTLTGHFRWAKRDASGNSDRWIQVGTWGVGLTLV